MGISGSPPPLMQASAGAPRRLNTYERILTTVTPKFRYTFYLDSELREALATIKERDGISESEQIRRAIKGWIEQKDVRVKAPSRRSTKQRKG
jgi:hypothetical protein